MSLQIKHLQEALGITLFTRTSHGLALTPDILAVGDVDHLLSDDPGARELELSDGLVRQRRTLCDPFSTKRRQPPLHVDRLGGVGVRPRRVVEAKCCPIGERDFAPAFLLVAGISAVSALLFARMSKETGAELIDRPRVPAAVKRQPENQPAE